MFRQAWEAQGIDLSPWDDMSTRLDPSHPLWSNHHPSLFAHPDSNQIHKADDPLTPIKGFRSISLSTRLIPSGPWPTDETQRIIGGLSRLLSSYFWKALVPILMMKGMEKEKAEEIVVGSLEELMDDQYRAYLKSKIWTARRI